MSTAHLDRGWVKVKGGHHHCALCNEFVEALSRKPVWVYYRHPDMAVMTVCGPCAKTALKDRSL